MLTVEIVNGAIGLRDFPGNQLPSADKRIRVCHAALPPFLELCHRYAVWTRRFVRGGVGDCPNSPGVMLEKPASAWAGMPDRPIHYYFGVDYELV